MSRVLSWTAAAALAWVLLTRLFGDVNRWYLGGFGMGIAFVLAVAIPWRMRGRDHAGT